MRPFDKLSVKLKERAADVGTMYYGYGTRANVRDVPKKINGTQRTFKSPNIFFVAFALKTKRRRAYNTYLHNITGERRSSNGRENGNVLPAREQRMYVSCRRKTMCSY